LGKKALLLKIEETGFVDIGERNQAFQEIAKRFVGGIRGEVFDAKEDGEVHDIAKRGEIPIKGFPGEAPLAANLGNGDFPVVLGFQKLRKRQRNLIQGFPNTRVFRKVVHRFLGNSVGWPSRKNNRKAKGLGK
jgi:hypothetical protein